MFRRAGYIELFGKHKHNRSHSLGKLGFQERRISLEGSKFRDIYL